MPPRIKIASGARQTEDLLLAELDAELPASGADLELLARPLRVIVPSAGLRHHLLSALVRRRGSAVGITVQTLWGAALEALERWGEAPPRSAELFEIAVARLGRREEPLGAVLDELADGWSAAAATVRDLLDAGLEEVHAEAIDEYLAGGDGRRLATPPEIARARALGRLALGTAELLGTWRLPHRSELLRRAREAIEADPQAVLPTRALHVHGFADATGRVTDLIEALLRAFGATLWLDLPPAASPGLDDAPPRRENAFPSRFLGRLSLVAQPEEIATPTSSPGVRAFAAGDARSEMRAVGLRIRALLETGERPESIAVVARDLEPYALSLRREFEGLGIPFSGLGGGHGPLDPALRPLAALRELLERGSALPLERWLDLRSGDGGSDDTGSDLRLAFFVRGASRLEEAGRLELGAGETEIPLPVRLGLGPRRGEGAEEGDETEIEGDEARAWATRRKLPASSLARAAAEARALCQTLEAWRVRPLALGEHVRRLRSLAEEYLGWDSGKALQKLDETLAPLGGVDAAGLELDFAEFSLAVGRALDPANLQSELGGRGGGVQVHNVTEARALSFDHLFLAGMNRDVFPRPIQEDALLPDRLRLPLAQLLPDLPVKAAGFDEERYLFAQLLSAAPRVTLSWQDRDAQGRERLASPLIEAWLDAAEKTEPEELASDPRRPLLETLTRAAILGGFDPLIETGLGEVRRGLTGEISTSELARARRAILAEFDPPPGGPPRLGPYFGFLGPADAARDPRRRELHVTTLENLAACPWQTFLRRLLRLEPLPDPLQALPELRGLLVGSVVHEVLEEIARRAIEKDGAPADVPWPGDDELEDLLQAAALDVLQSEGLALPGLARAAAEQARPYLEVARQSAWPGDVAPSVEAVETRGELEARDTRGDVYRIGFRADRADLVDGERHLTDYKTGRPISLHKTEKTRRRELLRAVAAGEKLQVMAYVAGGAREGRYLFLRPELDESLWSWPLEAGDAEARRLFERALGALLDLWREGAFFPRLVEPDRDAEPRRCDYCEVAEACLRRDSGARRRLSRWAEALDPESDAQAPERVSDAEAALHGVWRLARRDVLDLGEGEE